jgi:hypothetical protein
MTTPAARIRNMGDAVLRLGRAFAQAVAIQYAAPLGASARIDTTERSRGTVSNPTLDTATDSRRLRLRAADIGAEVAMDTITTAAHRAADDLDAAIDGAGHAV